VRLRLYYARGSETDNPANRGLADALELLPAVEAQDISVEIVDTKKISREELREAYFKACQPAVFKHFGIRLVFGSRRRGGGPFFGKEVPALLVYYEEEGSVYPSEVYPHQKPGGGPLVTIKDFLMTLTEGEVST
jgi:hypothetical protein